MTMWLHCSICPATSLCQSSGRTVSWGTTVRLAVTAESLKQLDLFLFNFFGISLCFLSLFTVCFVSTDLCLDPSQISLVSGHFILCATPFFRLVSSCLVSLGLRGKELSESLFLSSFSYPTFRLRWRLFFIFSLLLPAVCRTLLIFHPSSPT